MNHKIFYISKTLLFNVLALSYIVFVLVNYHHNEYDEYEKIKLNKSIQNSNSFEFFQLKNKNLKLNISEKLIDKNSSEHFQNVMDRKCLISGDMENRHKVRWVRVLAHNKLLTESAKINKTAPYYVEIILHGLLIFLAFTLLRKTFPIPEKYFYLYFLSITFIFQQHLGEYTYSIFDLFFIACALYTSNKNNIFFFIIVCIFATLNRETGFLLTFSWLVFNQNFKQFLIILIVSSIPFVLLNFDIFSCLIQPKFFVPLEYQHGQVNYSDLKNLNIFSTMKTILINYLVPFGFGFYFYYKTKKKNKFLFLLFFLYLFVFLVASPLGKIELKLLLIPYIWLFIYLSKNYKLT